MTTIARTTGLLDRLTIEEKVGQMFMFGFPGTAPSPEIEEFIGRRGLGGVIYFARNVADVAQVAALSEELQEAAGRGRQDLPLFIAADQEGGIVARFTGASGMARMPGNMALGATRDAVLTEAVAAAVGEQLSACGINVNLAPVLDVNVNPANPVIGVRSFGEAPALVADLGAAAVRGYQKAGVLATGKHFPGHGDTDVDSHRALPLVPHGRDRLEAVELLPFREAIKAGLAAIMTSHVFFPAIEPEPGLPATLSPRVLTGLLRGELGFDGLIMTDCLEMKAVTDNFPAGEAAVRAVEAGADLVLVSHTPERQAESLEAVLAAVRRGDLGERRIDESVARILAYKARYGAGRRSAPDLARRACGTVAQRGLALQAALRAVTIVRDRDGLVPLPGLPSSRPVSVGVVGVSPEPLSGVEEGAGAGGAEPPLAVALSRAGVKARGTRVNLRPTEAEVERAVSLAARADVAVVATVAAHRFSEQVALVKRLLAAGRPVIVVALREPYDLTRFPEAGTFIAAYDDSEPVIEAVARVLAGQDKAAGRLPVTIPGIDPTA
ncbi:MAG: beta-N-acetylhexosaminidase [Bacillota bacterium]